MLKIKHNPESSLSYTSEQLPRTWVGDRINTEKHKRQILALIRSHYLITLQLEGNRFL